MSAGPGRPLPVDGALEVALDRYLLPATVTRQSFVLLTADNEVVAEASAPVVTYDPVSRTVTLRAPRQPWLEPGRLYRLFLRGADERSELGGILAVDGATLAPGQRRLFEFFTTAPTGQPYQEPPVHFCADVLPLLAAKCGGGTCHGASAEAAAGLVLTTTTGVATTAIGRVAHATNTSGRAADPEPAGPVFGINMPIVAPGSPAESWLLYAVEVAPPPRPEVAAKRPPLACAGVPGGAPFPPPASPWVPLLPAPPYADALERDILGSFVAGRAMPYPAGGEPAYATEPLTFDEREVLRRWIQQLRPGQTLPECGVCGAP